MRLGATSIVPIVPIVLAIRRVLWGWSGEVNGEQTGERPESSCDDQSGVRNSRAAASEDVRTVAFLLHGRSAGRR
jgi:hypothetical protein